MRRILPLTAFIAALCSPTFAQTIIPQTIIKDVNGNTVRALEGSIIQVGATYYWYGEDMTKFQAWYFPFTAITCYSSTDLSHWKFENNVVTSAISGYQTINHGCRPHVIYNQSTSTYVMWLRTHKVGSTYGACQ